MEGAKEKAQMYKEKVTKMLRKYESIVSLEKQSGIDIFYIGLVLTLLSVSLLYAVGGATLVVNLVGFIYPAYMSFKALSTKQDTNDDTQWLTYWVVYAFFNIFEQFADIFLSWIPFYFVMKVSFLLWCYLPQTLGAQTIYLSIIKPYFWGHVAKIDKAFKKDK